MGEEKNASDIIQIVDCSETNLPAMLTEEGSLTSKVQEEGSLASRVQEEGSLMPKVQGEGSLVSKSQEVAKPKGLDSRRHSTGVIGMRGSKKPQVKSRYRGDYHVSSTHDYCKLGFGKKCDQADVLKLKAWNSVKVDTLSSRKKPPRSGNGSIPSVTKVAAKRDVSAVKKKLFASVSSDSSSVKELADGSSVESDEKARKEKETESSLNGSVVKKDSAVKKSKEKAKIQTVTGEDVKEKTVEPSVEDVQLLSEKVTAPISVATKIDNVSEDIEAKLKPEKVVKPKRAGVKSTITKQLTFKKGKVLEPIPEDSSLKMIKFRKSAVKEQKTKTEEKMTKSLKPVAIETKKTDTSEGSSQQEKVVLKEVEGNKKKKMTLLNNVIEETMKKFTKARKHKVEAIIGAFETVISLQNNKTSQSKSKSKTFTS